MKQLWTPIGFSTSESREDIWKFSNSCHWGNTPAPLEAMCTVLTTWNSFGELLEGKFNMNFPLGPLPPLGAKYVWDHPGELSRTIEVNY